MMKLKRQSKVLELIKTYHIETQEELAERLVESGFAVTQATISRDIRELKLTKVVGHNGKPHYVTMVGNEEDISERHERIFQNSTVSMDYANNILIIKTLSGMAMAVGAVLDAMDNTEIIGTICGDNTVMCVVRNEEKVLQLMDKLKTMLNNKVAE